MNFKRLSLIVVLFLGCAVVSNAAELEEVFRKTLPSDGLNQFELLNINGEIEISGTVKDQIEIKAIKKVRGPSKSGCDEVMMKLTIDVNCEKQVCIVKTKFPNKINYSITVDYQIQLPKRFSIKVNNTNGDAIVADLNGEVKIALVNGTVEVKGIESGKITSETTNGNIKVTGHIEHNNLQTTNGNIDIMATSFAKNALLFAEIVNGNIQLTLPSNANARVKAETVNGTVSISPWKANYNKRKNLATLVLGNGEGTIQLETTNGEIEILGK